MQTGAPLYNKDKISLVAKKKPKKKRPLDLEKLGWMDAKQEFFFIWTYHYVCTFDVLISSGLVTRFQPSGGH